MIALDTNILVRLIVADDPAQTRAGMRLMQRGGVLILASVLLETEWVLRSVFGLNRRQIVEALQRICGLEDVCVEHPEDTKRVLDLFADGMDFADAMHVVGAGRAGAQAFASFDAKLRRRMSRLRDLPAATSPG